MYVHVRAAAPPFFAFFELLQGTFFFCSRYFGVFRVSNST